MPYDSRATLVTQLTEVRTQIEAAQKAVEYGIGSRTKKMNLKALYDREKYLLFKIEAIDRYTSGFGNKVKFARPV